MPAIGVSEEVFDRIGLLAQAWEIPHGQVVARLLAEFRKSGRPRSDEDGDVGVSGIPIHGLYQGHRIEARYDPMTEQVTVESGPLAGRSYRTPSGAACAVVVALNPQIQPNRNGWTFWIVTESGEILLSLRRH